MRISLSFAVLLLVGCIDTGRSDTLASAGGQALSAATDEWLLKFGLDYKCVPSSVNLFYESRADVHRRCATKATEHRLIWACFFPYDDGTSGIVADSEFKGDDSAKVLTHELMHWLGYCNSFPAYGDHDDPEIWGPDGVLRRVRERLGLKSKLHTSDGS